VVLDNPYQLAHDFRHMIAKRLLFGCLVVVMSVCTWTIGRAAEDPGQSVYDSNCSRCHRPEGRGAKGPALVPFRWTYDKALEVTRHPACEMPAFSESDLSDADVAKIVASLKTIK
jgi:Cytochrome C oxidase, cbb3-type, subunit III